MACLAPGGLARLALGMACLIPGMAHLAPGMIGESRPVNGCQESIGNGELRFRQTCLDTSADHVHDLRSILS